jgi:hypothetical protein
VIPCALVIKILFGVILVEDNQKKMEVEDEEGKGSKTVGERALSK